MAVEITTDFSAICREENIPCNFITRCGHKFHFECLWTGKYSAETTKECPYCRQYVSNFTEKEKLLSKMKIIKMDKPKTDELLNFLDAILSFRNQVHTPTVPDMLM